MLRRDGEDLVEWEKLVAKMFEPTPAPSECCSTTRSTLFTHTYCRRIRRQKIYEPKFRFVLGKPLLHMFRCCNFDNDISTLRLIANKVNEMDYKVYDMEEELRREKELLRCQRLALRKTKSEPMKILAPSVPVLEVKKTFVEEGTTTSVAEEKSSTSSSHEKKVKRLNKFNYKDVRLKPDIDTNTFKLYVHPIKLKSDSLQTVHKPKKSIERGSKKKSAAKKSSKKHNGEKPKEPTKIDHSSFNGSFYYNNDKPITKEEYLKTLKMFNMDKRDSRRKDLSLRKPWDSNTKPTFFVTSERSWLFREWPYLTQESSENAATLLRNRGSSTSRNTKSRISKMSRSSSSSSASPKVLRRWYPSTEYFPLA